LIEIAQQINSAWTSEVKVAELNADLLRQFAYQATGNISPMQAVIGGIAAQEVLKVWLLLMLLIDLQLCYFSYYNKRCCNFIVVSTF